MSNAVDGGHRAIKYTRLNGVKPDIYNEGTHLAVCRPLSLFHGVPNRLLCYWHSYTLLGA